MGERGHTHPLHQMEMASVGLREHPFAKGPRSTQSTDLPAHLLTELTTSMKQNAEPHPHSSHKSVDTLYQPSGMGSSATVGPSADAGEQSASGTDRYYSREKNMRAALCEYTARTQLVRCVEFFMTSLNFLIGRIFTPGKMTSK